MEKEMLILICEQRDNKYTSGEYYCDFTRECDKFNFMLNNREDRPWFRTYLYEVEAELRCGLVYTDPILGREEVRDGIYIPFRVPGATRGHIKLDKDHIITEIKFYEDTSFGGSIPECYDRKVVEATKKYIGAKIVCKNEQ